MRRKNLIARNIGIVVLVILISLILGNTISNLVFMKQHAGEDQTMSNMNTVRLVLEDYGKRNKRNGYPTSVNDTTICGENFTFILNEWTNWSDIHRLENPYTKKLVAITFIDSFDNFPNDSDTVDIPLGEIYIFCNGIDFLILGGGKNSKSISLRLTSKDMRYRK